MWSYNHTFIYSYSPTLCHHGVKGQKWGVRNGPPYPLKKGLKKKSESSKIIEEAIQSGKVSTKINRQKQERHLWNNSNYINGKSYLYGDVNDAQRLVDELSGTDNAVFDRKGKWQNKEHVSASHKVGMHIDENGNKTETNNAVIVYSKTGSHIYPGKDDKE
ncbi:MAG: polymorphic toxin type 50 domain-containing protein [Clostridiales bacterium]|nr:polymorphic toxin type 50 domain-containing protein [Clostridiales bacterium]